MRDPFFRGGQRNTFTSKTWTSLDTLKWIHSSNNLFYAWHWYGGPLKVEDAIHAMLTIQQEERPELCDGVHVL